AADAARWTLGLGLVGGGLALTTGLLDLLAAPRGERVEKRLVQHLSAMIGALSCYGAAFVLPSASLPLQLVGLALLGAGGWLGGELVYRHGVGVPPPTGEEEPCESTTSPTPVGRS